MDAHLSTLVSRNIAVGSVLLRYRSVGSLLENGNKLINEIVLEMSERIPFLLDIFTVMVTTGPEQVESTLAPVAAAYVILIKARSDRLSAWHRITTFIAIKGHLDDSALTRFNHLGITQSVSTKLRLLEEAGQRMDTGIATKLTQNPLVKITGITWIYM